MGRQEKLMPQASWQNAIASPVNVCILQSYSEVGWEQPRVSAKFSIALTVTDLTQKPPTIYKKSRLHLQASICIFTPPKTVLKKTLLLFFKDSS